MARHETFTLDPETATRAARMAKALHAAQERGAAVTVTYLKRDDMARTPHTRTGTVGGFHGIPGLSSDSVLLECADRPATLNTWLILKVES